MTKRTSTVTQSVGMLYDFLRVFNSNSCTMHDILPLVSNPRA